MHEISFGAQVRGKSISDARCCGFEAVGETNVLMTHPESGSPLENGKSGVANGSW